MPMIPWWALVSSSCAPVVLIAGWVIAASLQPAGYDAMVQSISALAAQGATDRWVMTGALYLLGVCHAVTALGLRAASMAGRIALACGGAASIMVGLSPEPGGGGTTVRHLVSTGVGFTAIAVWSTLATVPHNPPVWALRRTVGYAITALMAVGAAWFLLELHGHGVPGLAERILTAAQSTWPLVVAAACAAEQLRASASMAVTMASTAATATGARRAAAATEPDQAFQTGQAPQ